MVVKKIVIVLWDLFVLFDKMQTINLMGEKDGF